MTTNTLIKLAEAKRLLEECTEEIYAKHFRGKVHAPCHIAYAYPRLEASLSQLDKGIDHMKLSIEKEEGGHR